MKKMLVFIFCVHMNVYAQKETNIWYFGFLAGIDFTNPSSPAAITSEEFLTIEEAATISDKNTGELLFVSDGVTIWNANHDTMVDRFYGLRGCWNCLAPSTTQGVLFVPQPGNDSIYYLFGVDCVEDNLADGFRYTIINRNLNGGLGKVILKDTLVITPVTEKLTAVRHANGVDVWVIVHAWESDEYLAYLLTCSGFSTTPVRSKTGRFMGGDLYNAIGYLKASSNGKKLASAVDGIEGSLELLDFDAATGKVSSGLLLANDGWYYGLSFSQDNSKLYATCLPEDSVSITYSLLYQYNLTTGARVRIDSMGNYSEVQQGPGTYYGALQMARNGKIYAAKTNSWNLGVINDPNRLGAACNYVSEGFIIVDSVKSACMFGLPNFMENFLDANGGVLTVDFTFNYGCAGDEIRFIPACSYSPETCYWDFGDPGSGLENTASVKTPVHLFSQPGEYIVTLIVSSDCESDTLQKTISICKFDVPNVFTPNKDGKNDVLYMTAAGFEDFEFLIYNRWGVMVFRSNTPENFWSGHSDSGETLPDGIYYYTLEARRPSDEKIIKQGIITLLK